MRALYTQLTDQVSNRRHLRRTGMSHTLPGWGSGLKRQMFITEGSGKEDKSLPFHHCQLNGISRQYGKGEF